MLAHITLTSPLAPINLLFDSSEPLGRIARGERNGIPLAQGQAEQLSAAFGPIAARPSITRRALHDTVREVNPAQVQPVQPHRPRISHRLKVTALTH